MFFSKFEERIALWVNFREKLEDCSNPLSETVKFWNQAPISPRICDPFNNTTWPDPWVLIESNHYCEFSKILAIYYTLVLTDRFKDTYFEIQIVNDREAQELKYILIVDDFVINYYYDKVIQHDEIPNNIVIQASYPMLSDHFTS